MKRETIITTARDHIRHCEINRGTGFSVLAARNIDDGNRMLRRLTESSI